MVEMARKKDWANDTRPEVQSASASTHYDEGEAIRYTTTNQSNQIQRDLTRHAVELLGLKVSDIP